MHSIKLKNNYAYEKIGEIIMDALEFKEKLKYTNFSQEEVNDAIKNGYLNIISIDDFKNNPSLLDLINFRGIEIVLKQSPEFVLMAYNKLSKEERIKYGNAMDDYGYVLTLEQFIEYPDLQECEYLVQSSIMEHPDVIKILQFDLPFYIAYEALERVELTLEDFIANPKLRELSCITKNPLLDGKYKSFYFLLSLDEKIALIKDEIVNRNYDAIKNSPLFMDMDIERVEKVLEFIKSITPEMSIEESKQSKYLKDFETFIDSLASLSYQKNKQEFIFSNVFQVSKCIHNAFERYRSLKGTERRYEEFQTLAFTLVNFEHMNTIKQIVDKGEGINLSVDSLIMSVPETEKRYRELLIRLFDIYNITASVLGEDNIAGLVYPEAIIRELHERQNKEITALCNEVLNRHRDSYKNVSREKILKSIRTLDFTPKKRSNILANAKYKKIENIIRMNGDYPGLDEKLERLNSTLKGNKTIKPIVLIDEDIIALEKEFRTKGNVSESFIEDLIKDRGYKDCLNAVKKLSQKYSSLIVQLFDTIKLTPDEEKNALNNARVDAKPHDFVLFDKNKTGELLAYLLIILVEEDKMYTKLMQNEGDYSELKNYTQFFELLPGIKEIKRDVFLHLVVNFDRIIDYIETKGKRSDRLLLCDMIEIAVQFNKMSDFNKSLLKQSTLDTIIEKNGEWNVEKYNEIYANEVFKRSISHIPQVFGRTDRFIYSTDKKDEDRLLIGMMYEDSCLDLNNSAGKSTFINCLTDPDADIILVKDKFENKVVTRGLVVRRGDVIQIHMRGFNGEIAGTSDPEYISILNEIGMSMAKIAKDEKDKVTIVLSVPNKDKNEDRRLVNYFPHADWSGHYTILGTTSESFLSDINSDGTLNCDFDRHINIIYRDKRKTVKEEVSDFDIQRLQLIQLFQIKDKDKRKEAELLLRPRIASEFISTYLGEDWFIGKCIDGSLYELIIESDDPYISQVQREEITIAKEKINGDTMEGTMGYGRK